MFFDCAEPEPSAYPGTAMRVKRIYKSIKTCRNFSHIFLKSLVSLLYDMATGE